MMSILPQGRLNSFQGPGFPQPGGANGNSDSITSPTSISRASVSTVSTNPPKIKHSVEAELLLYDKYVQKHIQVFVNDDQCFAEVDVIAVYKSKKKVEKWLDACSEYLGTPGQEDPEIAGVFGDDETSKFPLHAILKNLGYTKASNSGYQSYDVFEMRQLMSMKMVPKDGGEMIRREKKLDLPDKFDGAGDSCSSG